MRRASIIGGLLLAGFIIGFCGISTVSLALTTNTATLPDVTAGDSFTITVPSYADGGYDWSYAISPSAGIAFVSADPDYVNYPPPEPVPPPGWSAPIIYTFQTSQPGMYTITLTAQRSWETEPIEVDVYTVMVRATVFSNPFTDVKGGDWFYSDVMAVCQSGLMTGAAPDQFSPQAPVTRGMAVTVLYRLAGSPAVLVSGTGFGDVATGRYYTAAVLWAAMNNIVTGYGDGKFGPDDNVTREQLAVILSRYEQWSGKIPPSFRATGVFADQAAVSAYAADAVSALTAQGLINGKPGNLFDPQGTATRAEFAAVLNRFCEAVK